MAVAALHPAILSVPKRVFDICLALVLVLLLAPVMLFIALLVRTTLGSPILFSQPRTGLHGSTFHLYKFRSMKQIQDAQGKDLPDEARLTAFGRFLRASSLDELPELFNILTGSMSFVGPRPLITEYLPLYSSEQARRHEVRPGLTGWAQINGRNSISWPERFMLDIWYVDNWSLTLDLKIIIKTITAVVRARDISPENSQSMPKFGG